jgi:U3 small nucleolar RNA-associated protein 14
LSGSDDEFRKGEDESIDDNASDIGWDSEDELAFGRRNSKNGGNYNSDDENESESDQEEPKDGEILLSDMLETTQSKSQARAKSSVDSDSDKDQSGSASDDEDDLDDIHNRLLDSIEKFSKTEENLEVKRKKHLNQMTQESSYSSMLDGTQVSMDALLGALDNTRDLNTIKKRLTELEKGLAAPSYVEKVTSDRMERHQAYEGTKQDMNKWQDTVVANRHVAVLDLAQDKRQLASYKQLVSRHVPTTSLEKDIQMILVKHGTSDQAADQIETDELGSRNISPEEIREKQAELAKVKALMFYEQMKRHRLNKIKSKAYRSIHKRQRLKRNGKNQVGDEDDENEAEELTEEQKEKNVFDRVKERMDMRHKNTSKWSKMALMHGHANKDLKYAHLQMFESNVISFTLELPIMSLYCSVRSSLNASTKMWAAKGCPPRLMMRTMCTTS